MSDTVRRAAETASQSWKAAFNRGDAQGCAECYSPDARMTAKPFGTFHGRAEIQAFWEKIIADGFSDVEYLEPELTVVDPQTVRLKSRWRMNKAEGIILNELWVLQADGTALLMEDDFEVTG